LCMEQKRFSLSITLPYKPIRGQPAFWHISERLLRVVQSEPLLLLKFPSPSPSPPPLPPPPLPPPPPCSPLSIPERSVSWPGGLPRLVVLVVTLIAAGIFVGGGGGGVVGGGVMEGMVAGDATVVFALPLGRDVAVVKDLLLPLRTLLLLLLLQSERSTPLRSRPRPLVTPPPPASPAPLPSARLARSRGRCAPS